MRTCFSTCRSTSPGTSDSRCRRLSAATRRSSRSSPKTLECDLRAHAREHVVETMRDRLPDIDRHRQHGKSRPEIVDDLDLRPAVRLEDRHRFRTNARPRHARRVRHGRCGVRPLLPPAPRGSGARRSARRGGSPPVRCPGLNSMLMVNVPSLNGGRKARGR